MLWEQTCPSEQSSSYNFISEFGYGWEWCVGEESMTPLSLTGRSLGLLWHNAASETGWCHETQQWDQCRGQGNARLQFQVFYKERMAICLYFNPSSVLKFKSWKNGRVAESKIWNWVSPCSFQMSALGFSHETTVCPKKSIMDSSHLAVDSLFECVVISLSWSGHYGKTISKAKCLFTAN